MILDVDHGKAKIVVRNVPLRLNQVMQGIIGARHVRDSDDWTVPLSWPGLWQIFNDVSKAGEEVKPSEELRAWSDGEYGKVEYIYSLQTAEDETGNTLLYPLQRVAAAYLLASKRSILGSEMGAGKTVVTSEAISLISSRTILIACPKSVAGVWENHLHQWCPDVVPIIAGEGAVTRKKSIKEAQRLVALGRRVALIMNYESVWRHTKLSPYGNLRMERCAKCDPHAVAPVSESKCEVHTKELNEVDWECVVMDEAHRAINVTKQTRGLWHLTRNAEYVWCLTGTPTRGTVADFWSLLRMCDPDSWPSRSKFIDRYCLANTDNWGNLQVFGVRPDRTQEFEQVTQQYMLRHTFEQTMRSKAAARGEDYHHIEKVEQPRMVDLTKAQRTLYNDLADSMFATTPEGKVIFADNALEELTRLLQVSSAMLSTNEDGKVTMVSPSPKVAELLEVVRDAGGKQVVVYAVNRGLIDLAREALEREGYTTAVVHGGIDQAERDIEVARFQDGSARIFLGTYGAASEGITLTASNIMVRMQLSWSMILNRQTEGRILRDGQTESQCLYVDLIADDTVESRVHEAYGDKLEALEAIVRDNPKKLKELITGKAS